MNTIILLTSTPDLNVSDSTAALLVIGIIALAIIAFVLIREEHRSWDDLNIPQNHHCNYCSRDYVRMKRNCVVQGLESGGQFPAYKYFEMQDGKLVRCPEAEICHTEHKLLAETQSKLSTTA